VSVAPLNRTLEQELFALLRGASLECPVCGEFVMHRRGEISCPECGMRLHREEPVTTAVPQFDSKAG